MAKKFNPLYFELFPVKPGKGEIRKAVFIEMAIRLIAKRGEDAMNFESLARSMKVPRSHLAYYFDSKDDLLLEAVKLVTATAQHLIVERMFLASTPRSQLKALVDANIDWLQRYPNHLPVMLYFTFKCRTEPRFRSLNATIRKSGHERLAAMLSQWPHSGQPDINSDARIIQNVLTAEITAFGSHAEPTSVPFFGKSLWHTTEQTLGRLGYATK